MIPYILMLLFIIFCIYREDKLNSKKKIRQNFIGALVPVLVLIAFKSPEIGSDTSGYLLSYEILGQYGTFESIEDRGYGHIELGYKYFIYFLSRMCTISQTLLFAVGLIVCYALYKFIWNNAQNKCLLLFLFITMGFFQFAMSGIRQTIAISITLLSYRYIKDRKFYWFISFMILAWLFHKSALVFSPVYFIANQKITSKKVMVMFGAMFVLFFSADKLLLFAADTMNYKYGIEETDNGYMFFFIVLLITILVTRSCSQLIIANTYNKMVINTNFISLALWTLRLISRTAERVSLYFMPYTYLSLEEYIMTRTICRRRQYVFFIIILASALFLKRLGEQKELCNFKFFFQ